MKHFQEVKLFSVDNDTRLGVFLFFADGKELIGYRFP
jgi:hypothetical protein